MISLATVKRRIDAFYEKTGERPRLIVMHPKSARDLFRRLCPQRRPPKRPEILELNGIPVWRSRAVRLDSFVCVP